MQILGIILTHSLAEVTLLQGEPVIRLQTLTLLASLKNAACLKVSCYNESLLCCLRCPFQPEEDVNHKQLSPLP